MKKTIKRHKHSWKHDGKVTLKFFYTLGFKHLGEIVELSTIVDVIQCRRCEKVKVKGGKWKVN